MHPGFGEAQVLQTRVNLRPAMPNNFPLINAEPGLIKANGLFRHGFLLAPVVVEKLVKNVQQHGFQCQLNETFSELN